MSEKRRVIDLFGSWQSRSSQDPEIGRLDGIADRGSSQVVFFDPNDDDGDAGGGGNDGTQRDYPRGRQSERGIELGEATEHDASPRLAGADEASERDLELGEGSLPGSETSNDSELEDGWSDSDSDSETRDSDKSLDEDKTFGGESELDLHFDQPGAKRLPPAPEGLGAVVGSVLGRDRFPDEQKEEEKSPLEYDVEKGGKSGNSQALEATGKTAGAAAGTAAGEAGSGAIGSAVVAGLGYGVKKWAEAEDSNTDPAEQGITKSTVAQTMQQGSVQSTKTNSFLPMIHRMQSVMQKMSLQAVNNAVNSAAQTTTAVSVASTTAKAVAAGYVAQQTTSVLTGGAANAAAGGAANSGVLGTMMGTMKSMVAAVTGASTGVKVAVGIGATLLTGGAIALAVMLTRRGGDPREVLAPTPSISPSAMPSLEECGLNPDTEKANLTLWLDGISRPLNLTERTTLEGAFLHVYNNLSGGCDDVYERFLQSAELSNQNVIPTANDTSYLEARFVTEI